MRYYKPQRGDKDYQKINAEYPFVLIAFHLELDHGDTKHCRIVVSGNYQDNKKD